jgi:hypothetical protein
MRKESTSARFEVLTALLLSIFIFWGVMLYCWVIGAWCVEGPQGLQLHSQIVKEAVHVF